MCSGGSCSQKSQNQCCAALLGLYAQLYQLYLTCPPTNINNVGAVPLKCLLDLLAAIITPIFQRLQCGQVFCCQGYVTAIFSAFQTALSALSALPANSTGAQVDAIIAGLLTTLQCIANQTGFIGALSLPASCARPF